MALRKDMVVMVANVLTEVIPVWFIKKWVKENAEVGSALDTYIKTMLKDWEVEEYEQYKKTKLNGTSKVEAC